MLWFCIDSYGISILLKKPKNSNTLNFSNLENGNSQNATFTP